MLEKPFLSVLRSLLLALACWSVAVLAQAAPSVAFFYGKALPLPEIKAFDIVVVEPGHNHRPNAYRTRHSELYAYVAVGEVEPSRPYLRDVPKDWFIARNGDWNARVVDLSRPEWADFVADRIVAPLWQEGYRGFFLDTLDSYRLAARFDEAAQQDGLVRVVERLHARFPGIRLILNRGFEVLPRLTGKVQMVAAESLYGRWLPREKRYGEVPAADRDWLLGQLRRVRDDFGLPAIAIDYAPPQDRARTREIAQRIKADGLIPWVADGDLETLGVGSVEVVPRRLLALYDSRESEVLNFSDLHAYWQMPLNHLGYIVDFVDLRQPLPAGVFADRYAGVVMWTHTEQTAQGRRLPQWLAARMAEGLPMAIMGNFGFPFERASARAFGLKEGVTPAVGKVSISRRDAMIGLEAEPRLSRTSTPAVQLAGPGEVLVEVSDEKQQRFVGGALTPWGGFMLDPFVLRSVPGGDASRWIVDPFAFTVRALRLPSLPVADTTTETGRRMLLTHIDGDGFASLAEMSGSPPAAQVLLTEVLEKFRIPTAMSVIEAEVSADGLYPKQSAQLEAIARRMFALPHVELGSHTYSHPYVWDMKTVNETTAKRYPEYNLPIPGYVRSLEREIVGSSRYIENRLAPPGKKVKLLQWSGDTTPDAEALEITARAGLLNINGGDTSITRANPTLTAIGANGIRKNGYLQVYAPITNENIYTNLWTGPFYGFDKVVETFEMTETPRRLKPVGIYYHTYSASKPAALRALVRAYQWALARPLHHVYPSEFARKVIDFYDLTLARDGERWLVRGNGDLRTLRLPASLGVPDMAQSQNVAGYTAGSERYAHLAGDEAVLVMAASDAQLPYVYDANVRISDWQHSADGRQAEFTYSTYQAGEIRFANTAGCQVAASGKLVKPARQDEAGGQKLQVYALNSANGTVKLTCPAR